MRKSLQKTETGGRNAARAVRCHGHIRLTVHKRELLDRVHCIGVGVAASWRGEMIAEVLKRLIAQMGRPAAYLKDGGSELQKAVDLLGEHGLSGSSALNRGHEHQRSTRRLSAREGRPRCLGRGQRGGGT